VPDPSEQFFAVVAPGLEEVCAAELQALGIAGVQVVNGGVEFSGGRRDLYRANLWLRSASRVLVRIGEARCTSFPELFQKCVRLPWGKFIRPGVPFQVRATSQRSRLIHTDRIAATVADGVARALGGHLPAGSDGGQRLQVRLQDDRATFSIDSSGELLHRRGYRQETAHAPLRETLAAGVLMLLNWQGQEPLLDPMCGSGTLLIEGGLLATNQPPGVQRSFAFMDWPRYRPGLWQALLAEAAREARPLTTILQGSDHSEAALASARRNAGRAGLDILDWQVRELAALPPMPGRGLLLCNPPYGERLGGNTDLRPLYRQIGQVCRRSLPGWRVAILTSDERLAGATGLPLHKKAVLSNGGITVGLYVSEGNSNFSA
jgi:putative N6-adenine-specific DNA methylase